MLRTLLLTLSAWLILGFAPAKPPKDYPPPGDCNDDRMVDRCRPEQQRRVRELFGLQPIEAHRDAGDQVRRAFYVDGYGRDVVAIVFIRPKGGDPALSVHFPRDGSGRRSEPLRAAVPKAAWDSVIERSAHFARGLAPPPPAMPAPNGDQVINICIHSWVYTVEASDPPQGEHEAANIRWKTEDGCDNGLAEAYAHELERAAVSLLPQCDLLDRSQHRSEASLLSACSMLAGDRLAAAEVLNRTRVFRSPDDSDRLAAIFRYDATVDWNGERNAAGIPAAKFWHSKTSGEGGSRFYVNAVEGKSSGQVIVKGHLYRSVAASEGTAEVDEVAPVEQLWADDQGDFVIRSVAVGAFEREPRP